MESPAGAGTDHQGAPGPEADRADFPAAAPFERPGAHYARRTRTSGRRGVAALPAHHALHPGAGLRRNGAPAGLQRYLTQEGLKLRLSLPLDEGAGAKLALLFRLQERVPDLDRVELIARRVARFTREEAAYWLSRTTSFGADANRWALSGLRVMLGGQPKDPSVQRMLERLRPAG